MSNEDIIIVNVEDVSLDQNENTELLKTLTEFRKIVGNDDFKFTDGWVLKSKKAIEDGTFERECSLLSFTATKTSRKSGDFRYDFENRLINLEVKSMMRDIKELCDYINQDYVNFYAKPFYQSREYSYSVPSREVEFGLTLHLKEGVADLELMNEEFGKIFDDFGILFVDEGDYVPFDYLLKHYDGDSQIHFVSGLHLYGDSVDNPSVEYPEKKVQIMKESMSKLVLIGDMCCNIRASLKYFECVPFFDIDESFDVDDLCFNTYFGVKLIPK